MEVFYTSHFKREAKRLPISMRSVVEERLERFKDNPFDPSLKTHKLSGALAPYWSFSVNFRIRIIFEFDGRHSAVLHSIGDHSIYDNA